jgi:SSS family solute:Na+ symporter
MKPISLHWIDYAVVILYLGSMLGMGLYFMRRQKTTSEYLLASRSVGWVAIGLSLLSSLNSASDYVIGPAAYMQWGLLMTVGVIPLVICFPLILVTFIPFYQRLNLYNCYEYLEHRFAVSVRTTSSVIFIIWRICWMGMTLYLPAFVLNEIAGFDLIPTIIALGVITTTYTTLGGVRAVVWTDVAQAVIMFAGLVIAIGLLYVAIPGGWSDVWELNKGTDFFRFTANIPGWETAESLGEKIGLYFRFDMTFWVVFISCTISQLTNYGADQVMIQRYLSSKSLADCKKGFITNAVAYMFYIFLFMALSVLLLTFFQLNPLGEDIEFKQYFPYFIGHHMPVAIRGLIIAAIYSAAQSSVSAGVSASTSVIYSNIYIRLIKGQTAVDDSMGEKVQERHVWFARFCAMGLGVCVTTLACFIPIIEDDLFALFNKIVGNFAGVMIPVFLLGMFSRRVNTKGTAVGAVCGLIGMFLWGFGHEFGLFEIEMGYGWTSVVGFFTTIAVAYLFSLFEASPTPQQLSMTFKNVMARPLDSEADHDAALSSSKVA